ncbi:M23 family metallopeptidase [Flaviaesturariibacter aridisoli]|uniref:M23 family metallopeptidase n=1 Tax=Flaviaesturariibacter aridisoli TaxID=2545761 RepID=A0A4R4E0E2_9BACT|nr:M23 family metallopeptidase [Flaviaesturariibacter aridisoli]TCZ72829.1 M23 family metallopeptidase [Flaviaesturariibacter aridisoli]
MKAVVPISVLLMGALALCSCGTQHRFATAAEAAADSSPVYHLPYEAGARHRLVQGYNSWFSHKGRLGLDFKMKKGTLVTAGRAGVVQRAIDTFSGHGVNKRYLGRSNVVVIRHADGSSLLYGHLQQGGLLVRVGDSVQVGQPLARSGNVGYSAFPHLHLIAWGPTPAGRRALPMRFHTQKGIVYLRPGRQYRSSGPGPSKPSLREGFK